MEEQNVPQLRFPEFVDSLSNTRLGRISKFSKGKGISKSDVSSNGLDCIRYGELYTTYAELIDETISKTDLNPNQLVISEENDLIIPASGETAVDIATASCVKRSGIALGGDINIVKSEEDSRFLAYYLNGKKRNDIARYAQGSSVIHLYSTQLKLIRLNLPTVKEQQKIASFLSAVDKKIERLTRKKELLEEYKKGVMQKLFPKPGEQYPEFRFKDENGEDFPDWEVKRLGDIFQFKQGFQFPVEEQSENPFENSVQFIRIINVTSNPDDKRYVYDPGTNEHIKNEDLFMVRYGDAGKIVRGFTGIIANNMFRLIPKSNISKSWYFFLLQRMHPKISALAGSSTMPAIKFGTIRNLNIVTPTVDEQKKIALFLELIELKSELIHNKIKVSQGFKKGLLQQMFV